MEAVEKVLQVLDSLSVQDRRWVIERLPDSAKEQLISRDTAKVQLDVGVTEQAQQRFAADSDEDGLCSYMPSLAAKILAAEPTWIVEAILRSANATWRKQVLQCLPPLTRSAVLTLAHAPPRLARPVLDSLHAEVCSRLATLSTKELGELDEPVWPAWKRWMFAVVPSKWMKA